jgi:hypothetical protein
MTLHDGPVTFDNSIMACNQLGPLQLKNLGTGWSLLPLGLNAPGRDWWSHPEEWAISSQGQNASLELYFANI